VGQLQLAFQEFQLEGEKIGDLLNWVGLRERETERGDTTMRTAQPRECQLRRAFFFELADHVMFSAPVSFFFNN
jgi:hypothetical protein